VTTVALKDEYLDLRGLSVYSKLGVSTLRLYINQNKMPHFRLKGKILIKRSEFDGWMEEFRRKKKANINQIANEAMKGLKRGESNQ
jgi:excisionase family DNA binding protein